VEVEIRAVKISQGFFSVEYKLVDLPVNGQGSIPIGEWSEDKVREEIAKEIKGMKTEIGMLKKLITEWEGKKITLDI